MLGGGVFVTQSKILPGSYINFVNTVTTTSALGDRGAVAIALPLSKAPGKVIEITATEFMNTSSDILGKEYNSDDVIALREIFRNANKAYVYDLGTYGAVTEAIKTLEAYEFNVLCAYTNVAEDVTTYVNAVKNWRDTMGKKCQVVVYNQSNPDHEAVINVVSTIADEGAPDYALVAWVAGAEAGCNVNSSCTNQLYDGEYTIITNKSQAELEDCITSGQIVFHLVYGDVRLLEDINSLKTVTVDKGDDFKNNQTIRVIDQIANDIAKLFNTKYLGRIPNNASGRVSLWGDIVAHHRSLESINAIENFDATQLRVEQGASKKSVVVTDVIQVANCMTQLYMTVIVQ